MSDVGRIPDMAYFIRVNGRKLECDSIAELLALNKHLENAAISGETGEQVTVARKRKPRAELAETKRRIGQMQRALGFLEVVKSAGENGIGGKALVKKTGAKGNAGLGTLVALARRYVEDAGVDFDTVAQKKRGADKFVSWRPEASIDEAIAKVKTQLDRLASGGAE